MSTLPSRGTKVPSIASTHEGAAALQWNAHVGALPARDRDQPLAHLTVDVDEATVARPVVVPRRLLDFG